MKNASIILLFALLCNFKLHCQEAISSSGNFDKNANGSVSWTIGECMTETYTGAQTILTQGFQQPVITVTKIIELPEINYSVTANPNPASDLVKLKIGKEKIKGLQYVLRDMTGKTIRREPLQNSETDISFVNLVPSTYILIILDTDKEIKTFKIVKQ